MEGRRKNQRLKRKGETTDLLGMDKVTVWVGPSEKKAGEGEDDC